MLHFGCLRSDWLDFYLWLAVARVANARLAIAVLIRAFRHAGSRDNFNRFDGDSVRLLIAGLSSDYAADNEAQCGNCVLNVHRLGLLQSSGRVVEIIENDPCHAMRES